MATLYESEGGKKTLQFYDEDGKRQTLRLGQVTRKNAQAFKLRVELLLAAKLSGHMVDDETARWVAGLGQKMNKRLAAVGLTARRESVTLKAFVDDYTNGRNDIKDRSQSRIREAGQKLVDCFGANKRLRSFNAGDADRFRQWLIASGFAENTVRRVSGRAKQFFRAAMRRKLIDENPFIDLVSAVRGNQARLRFIDRATAAKVIEACPDAEWRLIFALSRFGGLRCPSETLSLRWSDVDWANKRVRVPSPKTEHIEGKESRLIPLFAELRVHLQEAWEQAEPGAEFVITRYRSIKQNLGTQLKRIITRAGIEPWPKVFQNLRSTRETELAQTYPTYLVCAWIGNSEAVARKHYLQVTDEHFSGAVEASEIALRKALQQGPETSGTASQGDESKMTKPRYFQGLRHHAIWCTIVQYPYGDAMKSIFRRVRKGFSSDALQDPTHRRKMHLRSTMNY